MANHLDRKMRALLATIASVLAWSSASGESVDAQRGYLSGQNDTLESMTAIEKAGVIPTACFPPTPLPTSPSANAARQAAQQMSWYDDYFKLFVWREPCQSDPTQNLLYFRVQNIQGVPFICSSAFKVIQNGNLYSVKLSQTYNGSSFCDDLSAPTTFIASSWLSPYFDPNLALQVVFEGIHGDYTLDLPAPFQRPGTPTPIASITPQAGLWWNSAESGSGYMLDVQHNVVVVTIYSYTLSGQPIWYIASGAIVNNVFTGALEKFQNGQCISCGYKAPSSTGNDGAVTMVFTSPTNAAMTLPGGRTFPITRELF